MLSREARILLALLFVLTGLIVYRVATREEPKRVKELTFKPGARGQGSGVSREKTPPLNRAGTVPDLRTLPRSVVESGQFPLKDKGPYRGVIRNPFQPLYPPEPSLPVILSKPSTSAPAPFPVMTSKGPSPAQMESGKVKFLGFLQKEGDRKVFLSREKEVFIVKKGDGIGNLQVGEIAENSVTLLSKDGTEEFRLTIEDVKPTKPGILPGGGRR